MQAMNSYDAPGFLNDLGQQEKTQWSDWISQQIDDAAAGDPQDFDFDAPRPRLFNALTTPAAADAVEKDITWTAFPRIVQLDSGTDDERWRTADSTRDVQDEYCEWSVTRRGDGKITRVTFTCEGPEYWSFLAAADPAKALSLYQQHVDSSARTQDILSGTRYNPRNKWNNSTTRGAMHLIQPNNTLSAEIELAAGASNTRAPMGQVLTDAQQLIRCGAYGQAERHSDPTIGAEVNKLARADADITLANPVGIYFAGLSTAGWRTPDGSDPSSFWTYTRGTPQKPVRAVFEVPVAKGFVVGDIAINDRAIQYGGQIADFITMKLTGVATRIGQSQHAPLQGCKRKRQALIAAALDVAAVVGAPALSTR
jgi:hypothetical protein